MITNSALGDTCQQVLNNCDKAYQSQRVLIEDQKQQIDNYFKKDGLQRQLIDDQKEKLGSPLRDPVKMIAVGAIGVIVLEIALGAFRS